MNLAYAINCAHDQLVEVSSKKKIGLKTKCHEQDVPNELAALLTNLQMLAHLLYRVCSDLLHPIKEHLELGESLFLRLLLGVHLSERLLLGNCLFYLTFFISFELFL